MVESSRVIEEVNADCSSCDYLLHFKHIQHKKAYVVKLHEISSGNICHVLTVNSLKVVVAVSFQPSLIIIKVKH